MDDGGKCTKNTIWSSTVSAENSELTEYRPYKEDMLSDKSLIINSNSTP